MKKKLLFLVLLVPFLLTGCIKIDSMEDINIYTSSYASEYIVDYLYGNNSTIHEIYPDGVIVSEYDLTDIQIEEYSDCDLFIYNGLSKEREYVNAMKKYNKDIKIIDVAYSMEYENSISELYINPSNFLMIAQNIKSGLDEYINNLYLKDNIQKKYDQLKVDVSNLDAKIYLIVGQSHNKNILVFDPALKFLEKYGLTIYTIDENLTEKDRDTVIDLLESGNVSNIFGLTNSDENDTLKEIIKDHDVNLVRLNDLSNMSESDRKNKKDYSSIMNENVDLLRQELLDE